MEPRILWSQAKIARPGEREKRDWRSLSIEASPVNERSMRRRRRPAASSVHRKRFNLHEPLSTRRLAEIPS